MPKKALLANDRSPLSATGRLFSTALFLAVALPGPWLFTGPAGQVSTALAAERQGAARRERATQQPNGADAAIGPRSQTLAQNETRPEEEEAESTEPATPPREPAGEQAGEQAPEQASEQAAAQEEPPAEAPLSQPGTPPGITQPEPPAPSPTPTALPAAPPPERQAAAERIPYEKAFPDE
ncbi:MAG: hypothetical protein V3S29_11190, partial [bacterium]